ncbi:hypothetical protein F4778DRAFT_705564 [Xylariomycetidae sp. FL2044]|nr:hypothetical protein F4778DRAFT_705564 [Xylariomycetidae sp. FL2044]
MTEIFHSPKLVRGLRGKVAVVTGGAQGIGAATVELLYNAGAHVFFGDWDSTKGYKVQDALRNSSEGGRGTVTFRRLDVRVYQSQVGLFDAAYQTHGHVDIAISCAAVKDPAGWFEPENLNMDTVRQEPIPVKDAIDINLTSVVTFCRIALAYMKTTPSPSSSPSPDLSKSITLVSSIAGITESPGLFAYGAAKHGVVGLMRALRRWAPAKYGVRANAICPWATDTQLLGVRDMWVREAMPMNRPADVARLIAQCAADRRVSGRAVFVAGGRGFDTEEGIDRTLPLWMGEKNARVFLRGQELLGLGDGWSKPKL